MDSNKPPIGHWLLWLCLLLPGSLLQAGNGVEAVSEIYQGQLDNGLKYYLQPHADPSNAAGVEVRLVVRTGSLHEQDGERGFAHLIEHLAFSGTKGFSEQQLDQQLLELGVASGQHRNAFTALDQTYYLLSLPNGGSETLDRALHILSDWAFHSTFNKWEVDRELLVVEEERLLRGAQLPTSEQAWNDLLLQGTRIVERSPIGNREDLAAATPSRLEQFYRKWYRPDRMAVIVVGNLEVKSTEQLVKQYFGVPAAPADDLYQPRPLNFDSQWRTGVVADAGATIPSAHLEMLQKRSLDSDRDWYQMITRLVVLSQVMNNRFAELLDQLDEEFVSIVMEAQQYQSKGSRIRVRAYAGESRLLEALTLLQTEVQRACQFGFQGDEVAFAKRNLQSGWSTWADNYAGSHSAEFVSNIQSHFVYGSPLPSPADYVEQNLSNLQAVTPADLELEIAPLCRGKDLFRSAGVTLPLGLFDKTRVSDQQLKQVLEAKRKVERKDYQVVRKLQLPAPGKEGFVHAKETYSPMSLSLLTLNNGVKVLVAPTAYTGEIYFSAFSKGGLSVLPGSNQALAQLAQNALAESPPPGLTANQYRQYLIDKGIRLALSITPNHHGLQGSFPQQHMWETLDLIGYLLSQHRLDPVVFARAKRSLLTHYGNIENAPDSRFTSQINRQLFANTPVYLQPTVAELERVTLQQVEQLYNATFARPANMNMILAGNFDADRLQTLLGKSLGRLKGNAATVAAGNTRFRANDKMDLLVEDNPNHRADIRISFLAELDRWDWEINADIRALGQLVGMEMFNRIRQEEGLAYAASGYGQAFQAPYAYTNLGLTVSTEPQNVERVIELFWEVVEKVKKNGFAPDQLQAVKTELAVRFRADMGNMESYIGLLMDCMLRDEWFHNVWKYPRGVENVDNHRLKQLARELLQKNRAQISTYRP